jgi:menaquinone-dependent protoporphyrinogen oxidase
MDTGDDLGTDRASRQQGSGPTVAVGYGTTEGQTARIAGLVGEVVAAHGYRVRLADLRDAGPDLLRGCAGVVLGASVHLGKHQRYVADYVRRQRGALDALPSAFFSVSLAALGDRATAERYVAQLVQQTGWQPATVGLFAGALPYTRYGFVKKRVMRRIARGKPGSVGTDLARDYDYTDPDAVRRFVEDFLVERVSVAPRSPG